MKAIYAIRPFPEPETVPSLLQRIGEIDSVRSAAIAQIRQYKACIASAAATDLFYRMLGAFRISPADVRVGWNNKPQILSPDGLCFNITHTDGFVGCVLSDAPCGIDIELRKKPKGTTTEKLARRFFSSADCERLENGADFFDIWCENEAYLKYTGAGLSLPMAALKKSNSTITGGDTAGQLFLPPHHLVYASALCLTPDTRFHVIQFGENQ